MKHSLNEQPNTPASTTVNALPDQEYDGFSSSTIIDVETFHFGTASSLDTNQWARKNNGKESKKPDTIAARQEELQGFSESEPITILSDESSSEGECERSSLLGKNKRRSNVKIELGKNLVTMPGKEVEKGNESLLNAEPNTHIKVQDAKPNTTINVQDAKPNAGINRIDSNSTLKRPYTTRPDSLQKAVLPFGTCSTSQTSSQHNNESSNLSANLISTPNKNAAAADFFSLSHIETPRLSLFLGKFASGPRTLEKSDNKSVSKKVYVDSKTTSVHGLKKDEPVLKQASVESKPHSILSLKKDEPVLKQVSVERINTLSLKDEPVSKQASVESKPHSIPSLKKDTPVSKKASVEPKPINTVSSKDEPVSKQASSKPKPISVLSLKKDKTIQATQPTSQATFRATSAADTHNRIGPNAKVLAPNSVWESFQDLAVSDKNNGTDQTRQGTDANKPNIFVSALEHPSRVSQDIGPVIPQNFIKKPQDLGFTIPQQPKPIQNVQLPEEARKSVIPFSSLETEPKQTHETQTTEPMKPQLSGIVPQKPESEQDKQEEMIGQPLDNVDPEPKFSPTINKQKMESLFDRAVSQNTKNNRIQQPENSYTFIDFTAHRWTEPVQGPRLQSFGRREIGPVPSFPSKKIKQQIGPVQTPQPQTPGRRQMEYIEKHLPKNLQQRLIEYMEPSQSPCSNRHQTGAVQTPQPKILERQRIEYIKSPQPKHLERQQVEHIEFPQSPNLAYQQIEYVESSQSPNSVRQQLEYIESSQSPNPERQQIKHMEDLQPQNPGHHDLDHNVNQEITDTKPDREPHSPVISNEPPQISPSQQLAMEPKPSSSVKHISDMFVESTRRLKESFENIIEKYGDPKLLDCGDVIDLELGEIVEDNGHLRSMTHRQRYVWTFESVEQDIPENEDIETETETDGEEKEKDDESEVEMGFENGHSINQDELQPEVLGLEKYNSSEEDEDEEDNGEEEEDDDDDDEENEDDDEGEEEEEEEEDHEGYEGEEEEAEEVSTDEDSIIVDKQEWLAVAQATRSNLNKSLMEQSFADIRINEEQQAPEFQDFYGNFYDIKHGQKITSYANVYKQYMANDVSQNLHTKRRLELSSYTDHDANTKRRKIKKNMNSDTEHLTAYVGSRKHFPAISSTNNSWLQSSEYFDKTNEYDQPFARLFRSPVRGSFETADRIYQQLEAINDSASPYWSTFEDWV